MKNVLLTIVGLSLSQFTFAKSTASSEQSLVSGLIQPKIVVSSQGLAAVQPTAYLEFGYLACSKPSLVVEAEEKQKTIYVSVKQSNSQLDCFGNKTEHKYSLQISSDFRPGTQVVLLNPLPVEKKQAPSEPALDQCLSEAKANVSLAVSKQFGQAAQSMKVSYLGGETGDGDEHGDETLEPNYEYFVTKNSLGKVQALHSVEIHRFIHVVTGKVRCDVLSPESVDASEWQAILKLYK